MKINAIIVEDEEQGMENIVFKVKKNCPNIEILEKCYTGESAIEAIERLNPDLVFLDVRLGSMSGFDVLNKLPHISFFVIFTTAYNQYAVEAIKVSAIDYILKPIKPKELIEAVEKAQIRLHGQQPIRRISVPISNGYQFIPVEEISYCLADDCYTYIHKHDNAKILVTRTLKFIAHKLPSEKFYRISRSAVINLDFVDSFHRSAGGTVIMKNGAEISVSKDKRNDLLKRLVQ